MNFFDSIAVEPEKGPKQMLRLWCSTGKPKPASLRKLAPGDCQIFGLGPKPSHKPTHPGLSGCATVRSVHDREPHCLKIMAVGQIKIVDWCRHFWEMDPGSTTRWQQRGQWQSWWQHSGSSNSGSSSSSSSSLQWVGRQQGQAPAKAAEEEQQQEEELWASHDRRTKLQELCSLMMEQFVRGLWPFDLRFSILPTGTWGQSHEKISVFYVRVHASCSNKQWETYAWRHSKGLLLLPKGVISNVIKKS